MEKLTLKEFVQLVENEITKEIPPANTDVALKLRLAITNAILNLDASGYGVYKSIPGGNTGSGTPKVQDYIGRV